MSINPMPLEIGISKAGGMKTFSFPYPDLKKMDVYATLYDGLNKTINFAIKTIKKQHKHYSGCYIQFKETDIPGHDNFRGYGGKCFPKDVQAFIKWAEDNKLDLDMCKAAEKVNERVREVKDWLDIKGATSKNNYGL